MYEMGDQIGPLTDNRWRVASQSKYHTSYAVSFGLDTPTCDCEFHQTGNGRRCKHIAAVEQMLLADAGASSNEVYDIEGISLKCPTCKKKEYVRNGKVNYKYGKKQIYKCKRCKRQFRDNLGFEYRHVLPIYITLALMLHGMGMSLNNIQSILGHLNINES